MCFYLLNWTAPFQYREGPAGPAGSAGTGGEEELRGSRLTEEGEGGEGEAEGTGEAGGGLTGLAQAGDSPMKKQRNYNETANFNCIDVS